jgi:hypothetical protein
MLMTFVLMFFKLSIVVQIDLKSLYLTLKVLMYLIKEWKIF